MTKGNCFHATVVVKSLQLHLKDVSDFGYMRARDAVAAQRVLSAMASQSFYFFPSFHILSLPVQSGRHREKKTTCSIPSPPFPSSDYIVSSLPSVA
jgi:hypothetical protein